MGECQHGRPNHTACPWCEEDAARVKRLIEGHEANYILTKDRGRLAALEAVAEAAAALPWYDSGGSRGWDIECDYAEALQVLRAALARLDGEAR